MGEDQAIACNDIRDGGLRFLDPARRGEILNDPKASIRLAGNRWN
jgi:hypothetical protein